MTECRDHLASDPLRGLPGRCERLRGPYLKLGWRQFEVGPKQRVYYLVRGELVVVLAVQRTHPKKTE